MKGIDKSFEERIYNMCIAEYNASPRRQRIVPKKSVKQPAHTNLLIQRKRCAPNPDAVLIDSEDEHDSTAPADAQSKKKDLSALPLPRMQVNTEEQKLLNDPFTSDSDEDYENIEALEVDFLIVDQELTDTDDSEDEDEPDRKMVQMFGHSDASDGDDESD